MATRIKRARGNPSGSSLIGLYGGHDEGMSATSFQRKRRELLEQTSVAARFNEDGPGDPYAKTDDNYDAVGVKDTGTIHQEGNPPETSETGQVPEKLEEAQHVEPVEDEDGFRVPQEDEGSRQQDEGAPLTSVELREDEEPDDDGLYADQRKYAALDKRDAATAEASEANVSLAESDAGSSAADDYDNQNVATLKETAKNQGIEGYSTMRKAELIEALRGR